MEVFINTHKGNVRENNEDSIYISGSEVPFYAVVADGMGGHNAGKTASSNTISILNELLDERDINTISKEELSEIISETSYKLYDMANGDEQLEQMGSTLVLAVVKSTGITVANIGDSRAYILRGGELRQITKDHSYVQTMVDSGEITKDEAETHPLKNLITKAVGMKVVRPDIFEDSFDDQNVLLMCSDGLTRHVKDCEIKDIIIENSTVGAGERLIELALERGGNDNISVIIVKNGGACQ